MIAIIEEWQKDNMTFGLVLPDGWFGRPYDNSHTITWSADRPYRLLIEIDNQNLLVITKTKSFLAFVDKKDIVITNFAQVTFDRLGYGDMTPHAEVFKKGEVRLVSYTL